MPNASNNSAREAWPSSRAGRRGDNALLGASRRRWRICVRGDHRGFFSIPAAARMRGRHARPSNTRR